MERHPLEFVEPERAELLVRLVQPLVHHLNNNLCVLQSSLDLGDAEGREEASRQAQRLGRLLRSMGELTLQRSPRHAQTTLEGCIEAWLELLQAISGRAQVHWRPAPAGTGLVRLDEDAFGKAVVGLVAARLLSRGPGALTELNELTLSTRMQGSACSLLVLEGPPADGDLVDAARSHAASEVSVWGGSLETETDAGGRLVETIALPTSEALAGADEAAPNRNGTRRGRADGVRLAFVDHARTGDLLCTALLEEGAGITSVHGVEELARAVAAEAPDLVLVDLGELADAIDVADVEAYYQASGDRPLAILTPPGMGDMGAKLARLHVIEHPVTPGALFELVTRAVHAGR